MSVSQLGYLQILAGISMLGLQAVFIRIIDLPAPVLVGWHALITVASLTVVGVVRRSNFLSLGRGWRIVIPMGLLYCADHFLYTRGIQLTSIANFVVLAYLYPVFTVVLAVWILGEHITSRLLLALALGAMGTLSVVYPSVRALELDDLTASVMGITLAMIVAVHRILTKKLPPSVSSLTASFYEYLTIAVLFLPVVLWSAYELTVRRVVWLAISGVFTTTIAGFLVLAGVRKVEAQRGAILSYAEPIVASVLAWIVFREVPSGSTIFGGGLLLAAGYLVVTDRGHRAVPEDRAARL